MSLLKKLTDFCGGIAAFMGGLFLIQKYMAFKPKTDEEYIAWLSEKAKDSTESISAVAEAPGKLSQFFNSAHAGNDYRPIAILTALLIVAVLVSRVVARLPYVGFIVSLFPATMSMYLFCNNALFNQPSLFVLLSLALLFGNAAECIIRDRQDGKHRLWLCAKITMLLPSLLCLTFAILSKVLSKAIFNLSVFYNLTTNIPPNVFKIFITVGIMYFIILIISSLLLDVYFIDAVLSVIPLIYLTYQIYCINFSIFIPVLLLLAIVCFFTNLLLCIFENNLSKKEQQTPTEQQSSAEQQESTNNPELTEQSE